MRLFENVTCRECGQTGNLWAGRKLRRGRIVDDQVPHSKECSKYVAPQPKHLRKKKRYNDQEKRAANLVGARLTAASGALGMDGDARDFHQWRIEAKHTSKDAYFLTQEVWGKLVSGALDALEIPLLHVELEGGRVRRVVVPLQWFEVACGATENTEILPPRRAGKRHKVTNEGIAAIRVLLEPEAVDIPESTFRRLVNEPKP